MLHELVCLGDSLPDMPLMDAAFTQLVQDELTELGFARLECVGQGVYCAEKQGKPCLVCLPAAVQTLPAVGGLTLDQCRLVEERYPAHDVYFAALAVHRSTLCMVGPAAVRRGGVWPGSDAPYMAQFLPNEVRPYTDRFIALMGPAAWYIIRCDVLARACINRHLAEIRLPGQPARTLDLPPAVLLAADRHCPLTLLVYRTHAMEHPNNVVEVFLGLDGERYTLLEMQGASGEAAIELLEVSEWLVRLGSPAGGLFCVESLQGALGRKRMPEGSSYMWSLNMVAEKLVSVDAAQNAQHIFQQTGPCSVRTRLCGEITELRSMLLFHMQVRAATLHCRTPELDVVVTVYLGAGLLRADTPLRMGDVLCVEGDMLAEPRYIISPTRRWQAFSRSELSELQQRFSYARHRFEEVRPHSLACAVAEQAFVEAGWEMDFAPVEQIFSLSDESLLFIHKDMQLARVMVDCIVNGQPGRCTHAERVRSGRGLLPGKRSDEETIYLCTVALTYDASAQSYEVDFLSFEPECPDICRPVGVIPLYRDDTVRPDDLSAYLSQQLCISLHVNLWNEFSTYLRDHVKLYLLGEYGERDCLAFDKLDFLRQLHERVLPPWAEGDVQPVGYAPGKCSCLGYSEVDCVGFFRGNQPTHFLIMHIDDGFVESADMVLAECVSNYTLTDKIMGAGSDARRLVEEIAEHFPLFELSDFDSDDEAPRKPKPKPPINTLNAAAMYGQEEELQRMLAEIQQSSYDHGRELDVALAGAVMKGHTDCIEQLVRAGADVNAAVRARPMVMLAKKVQHLAFLVREGAEVDAVDRRGLTALMLRAGQNKVARVRELIGCGASLDRRDAWGRTALHHAADRRAWLCVELLLSAGADPNVGDLHGNTPLMYAVSRNDIRSLTALLNAGADASLRDCGGRTALHDADARQHGGALARMLFEYTATGGGATGALCVPEDAASGAWAADPDAVRDCPGATLPQVVAAAAARCGLALPSEDEMCACGQPVRAVWPPIPSEFAEAESASYIYLRHPDSPGLFYVAQRYAEHKYTSGCFYICAESAGSVTFAPAGAGRAWGAAQLRFKGATQPLPAACAEAAVRPRLLTSGGSYTGRLSLLAELAHIAAPGAEPHAPCSVPGSGHRIWLSGVVRSLGTQQLCGSRCVVAELDTASETLLSPVTVAAILTPSVLASMGRLPQVGDMICCLGVAFVRVCSACPNPLIWNTSPIVPEAEAFFRSLAPIAPGAATVGAVLVAAGMQVQVVSPHDDAPMALLATPTDPAEPQILLAVTTAVPPDAVATQHTPLPPLPPTTAALQQLYPSARLLHCHLELAPASTPHYYIPRPSVCTVTATLRQGLPHAFSDLLHCRFSIELVPDTESTYPLDDSEATQLFARALAAPSLVAEPWAELCSALHTELCYMDTETGRLIFGKENFRYSAPGLFGSHRASRVDTVVYSGRRYPCVVVPGDKQSRYILTVKHNRICLITRLAESEAE